MSARAATMPGMWQGSQPFIGTEALAAGELSRHELRTYYRAVMPNVYVEKRLQPSLRQRTAAAWLWSRREAVIAGSRGLGDARRQVDRRQCASRNDLAQRESAATRRDTG